MFESICPAGAFLITEIKRSAVVSAPSAVIQLDSFVVF